MPRYYNKTRSPLPLELPSGSRIAPAKSYVEIPLAEEGCASVVRSVKKGFLVPPLLRPEVAAAPAPSKPKHKPKPAPTSVTYSDSVVTGLEFTLEAETDEEELEAASEASDTPDDAETSSGKKTRRKKRTRE